jgi:hypothetical protein
MSTVTWQAEIAFDEDEDQTRARLTLHLPEGGELTARGYAIRNPADQPQARIGEEIAAARAFSDLTHQLVDKAAGDISAVTHRPAAIVV